MTTSEAIKDMLAGIEAAEAAGVESAVTDKMRDAAAYLTEMTLMARRAGLKASSNPIK